MLSIDFQSVVIGYAVGIGLMWSIHTVLFEEDNNDNEAEENDEGFRGSFYNWNYPYNHFTSK
jgi:hypothetical protein